MLPLNASYYQLVIINAFVLCRIYRSIAISQYLNFAINSPFVINSIWGFTEYPQMEFMTKGEFMAKLRYCDMAK